MKHTESPGTPQKQHSVTVWHDHFFFFCCFCSHAWKKNGWMRVNEFSWLMTVLGILWGFFCIPVLTSRIVYFWHRMQYIHTKHIYTTLVQWLQHLVMFNYSFWRNAHTHTHTLLLYCSTAADFVWMGCPDDMIACSRRLTEHRAPEVPEPQRLLCRQPKAYLQACNITHHYLSGVGVHHHELSNTGYWNIQMLGFPAERRFLSYKAWTYCITAVGIWNRTVSVGGLCCAWKISWKSWVLASVVEGGLW